MSEQRSANEAPTHGANEITGAPSMAQFLAVVSGSRWLIAIVAAGAMVLGIAYAILRTPIYQADTLVRVLSRDSGTLGGLEQFSALIQGSAVPTNTEIQLLQTRSVLLPVIRKLHLDIAVAGDWPARLASRIGLGCEAPATVSIFNVPRAFEGVALQVVPMEGGSYRLIDPQGQIVLTGRVGTTASGRVQTAEGPGFVYLRLDSIASCASSFNITRIPVDQAWQSLLKKLTIQEEGFQTGIIQVSSRGTSPELLSATLNGIAQANVDQNIQLNASQAAKQVAFLNNQLPILENKLHEAQSRLATFLSQHPTLAALSQSTEYLVTQTATLDQQIGPLQAQQAQAQAALGTRNPQLAIFAAQLDALKKERTKLLEGIAQLPKDQQTLVRLQSDVTNDEGLYAGMLGQVQTLQIAQAGTVGDVVIVDPAIAPSKPAPPGNLLILAISVVIGLFLGLMAAFARRSLHHGIEDPEVIDTRLGLPVYAVLPHCAVEHRLERRRETGSGGSHSILAALAATDHTTEALRSLRTALQIALPDTGPRILSVTSLGPSEGKSFLVSNLGYLFAQGGLRVLIVDADLRRGHLHRNFGWKRGKGFADLLKGEPLENVVRRSGLNELHVMTTGALPEDAANLLVHADIGTTLARLAELYDVVIMDMPPVMAVGDAFLIARHACLNLLVLKHGAHSIGQARFALKQLARQRIKMSGCVLNDVSTSAQRYAYRGYGYQYQYQYK